jgi:4'-phosphopantetheinyl transferase
LFSSSTTAVREPALQLPDALSADRKRGAVEEPRLEQTSSIPVSESLFEWSSPPDALTLPPDQVHLWKVPLDQPERALRSLKHTLASDERLRAERFHFDRDRRRFIAAHGQLRMILGRYTGIDPHELEFSYGLNGKPFFASPPESTLRFNLSHSGELALVAIAHGRDVGVDLEEIRALDDAARIAERFFTRRENAALCALPEAARIEAFFCCWTLKEAYMKATGQGLSRATDSFDVAFARDEPARLLRVEGEPQEEIRWSLMGLTPARGYVGAIAVEGHRWSMECWETRR